MDTSEASPGSTTVEAEVRPAERDETSESDGCILVVDDDELIRTLIAMALTDEGYGVVTARNGAQALERLQNHRPRLILLDMRMPVMDGWTFARHYRDLPGPTAPIVVMTAAMDAGRWASEVQADGWLAKPFELGDLLATVEAHTGQTPA